MKRSIINLFLMALALPLFITSCEKEVMGREYDPINLTSVQFDTIPTSALPYDSLARLGDVDINNQAKVDKLNPKLWWGYRNQNGVWDKGEPNEYATEEVKVKYREYLVKLDLYNSSVSLLKERKTGAIRIMWEHPASLVEKDSNMYVEVTYFDYKKGKEMRRNASSRLENGVYKGSLVVPGTLRTYTHEADGTLKDPAQFYKFTVTPVSGSLKRGNSLVIDNAFSSLFQPYYYLANKEVIVLTEKTIWLLDKNKKPSALNGDGDGGKFANLIDGKSDTFFHTDYSTTGSALFPFSFGIDAGGLKGSFTFEYNTRHNQANGVPTEIKIFASKDIAFANEEELVTLTKDVDKLPTAQNVGYTGPLVLVPNNSQFFRVEITKSSGGTFFSMAEFRAFTASTALMDPENKEEDRY